MSATVERGAGPTLALMSGFELWHREEPVALPMSAQRLLAFLALHSRPVMRLYAAGSLWLEASEERANASLRSTLWRLRRPGCPLVSVSPTHVGIAPEVRVDFRAVTATAHRLLEGDATPRRRDLHEMRTAGELLPDWYDDWIVLERERFRQLRLYALEELCRRMTAQARYGEAVEAGLAAIDAEPLRESAHRAVIAFHLAEGTLAEALRQYEVYRAIARCRLGIEPSAELRATVAAALGGELGSRRATDTHAARTTLARATAGVA